MANFLRFLLGLSLLPLCWGVSRAFLDALVLSAGSAGWMTPEALSLFGGILAFAFAWMALSHPVRAYVFGHELTHAIWGIAFGAMPSKLRVSKSGGSVNLTKSNMLITLAPYFFPFYTFLVGVAALAVLAFVRPLPWLPLWMFLIGFTWSFHILFTIDSLSREQPDVELYGRVFSWVFIFLANVALVLVWLAAVTPLSFRELGVSLVGRVSSAYIGVGTALAAAAEWIRGAFAAPATAGAA